MDKIIPYGTVCYDDDHNLGIITYYVERPHNILYSGVSFDGFEWFSENPTVITKNLNEYIESIVNEN